MQGLKHIILFILIRQALITYGQPEQKKAFKSTSMRTAMSIDAMLDSTKNNLPDNPSKAFDFVEQVLEQSVLNNDKVHEAYAYLALGEINSVLNQYDLALNYFQKARQMFISLKDKTGLMQSHKYIGESYVSLQQYNEALNNFKDYADQAKDIHAMDDYINARIKIGQVYALLSKPDDALRELNEVLKIANSENNKLAVVKINEEIGKIYLDLNKPQQAASNLYSNLSIDDKEFGSNTLVETKNSLGKALRKSKQYDAELELRQQTLNDLVSENDIAGQASETKEIGDIYIEKGEPEQAVPILERSIKLSDSVKDLKYKTLALKSLSKAYDEQRNYPKALEVYREYVATMDDYYLQRENELKTDIKLQSTLNRRLERVDMLEKDIELREKTIQLLEDEKDLQWRELRFQRRLSYILLSIMVIISIATFLVLKSSVQKRKITQLLALRSLRGQMNPHFIFNALNSVNHFIAGNNEREANRYLTDFSKLMRLVLDLSTEDFIPLKAEIDMLKLYLELEHKRFPDKFDYHFQVDENLNVHATEIPPMLVQPYIENAIWHGLIYKNEKGLLDVSFIQNGQFLLIKVEDNGIGREKSKQMKTRNQLDRKSTGIRNIETRVELLREVYKKNISVEIDDLEKSTKSGTMVRIKIPLNV